MSSQQDFRSAFAYFDLLFVWQSAQNAHLCFKHTVQILIPVKLLIVIYCLRKVVCRSPGTILGKKKIGQS